MSSCYSSTGTPAHGRQQFTPRESIYALVYKQLIIYDNLFRRGETIGTNFPIYSPFTIIRRAPILAEKYFSQARSILTVSVSAAYHTSDCS